MTLFILISCRFYSIWAHTIINELKIDSEEHPMLMSVQSLTPDRDLKKIIETIFETYNPPAFALANQAVLAMIGSDVNNSFNCPFQSGGIVLDIGDSCSIATPVHKGKSIPNATVKISIGGRDQTEFLMRELVAKGYPYTTVGYREIVRDIKEQYCYVAPNYEEEIIREQEEKTKRKKFYVPILNDTERLCLGKERFQVGECLFKPLLFLKNMDHLKFKGESASYPALLSGGKQPELHPDGIKHVVRESINKLQNTETDNAALKEEVCKLGSNIILAGGTSLMTGLEQRLSQEIKSLQPSCNKSIRFENFAFCLQSCTFLK